jgi:hypothetical protein
MKHTPTTPSQKPPSGEDSAMMELYVHLAEYNALTTRNTYWITLQYAVWPILLIYWTLIANVWSTVPHPWLVWGSGIITQAAVLNWCEAGYEIYNNVAYMEKSLRHKIEPLLPGKCNFWGYEPYLLKLRGTAPIWYEYGPLFGIFLLIGLGVFIRFYDQAQKLNMYDWVGIGVNLICFSGVVVKTVRLIRTRQRMS